MIALFAALTAMQAQQLWATFEGNEGPGKGKNVVLISGDEEYRSEEALTQLAKILAKRHGFHCSVLYAIGPDGTIRPDVVSNIPGLELLDQADLMICMIRFRCLPDDQMSHFDAYVQSGKPIIGLRTATHAFAYPIASQSPYRAYDWQNRPWEGGFGKQVLGETWVSHHGDHMKESTLASAVASAQGHPILRGVGPIWVPSDVYTVDRTLNGCEMLLTGQVLSGMSRSDPPVTDARNHPPMAVAWTKTFKGKAGKEAKIFTTTMGSGPDLLDLNLRRLLINASYWLLGLEVPARAEAELVGKYEPTTIGFGLFKTGLRPADMQGDGTDR